MAEFITAVLSQFPPALATVIISALPVTELRLGIPVAVTVWELRLINAFILALIGNIIPFFPLYFGLDVLRTFCEKHIPFIAKLLDSKMERARKKVEKKYNQYGAFALFLFTALPLPLTGLWTATFAAVALKIPPKYALYGIIPGIITAGIIVSILTAGAVEVF